MSGLRRAPAVAIVDEGDTIYAASLPDGPIVVLDGVAAVVWIEACNGDRSTIADRVAATTGAIVDEVRPDVEAFVGELVDRGLLESDPA